MAEVEDPAGDRGLSWLSQFLLTFLAPNVCNAASVLRIGAVGEVVFIGWLLMQGAQVPAPRATTTRTPTTLTEPL